MKRVISFILVFIAVFTAAVPVMAADTDFVPSDTFGKIITPSGQNVVDEQYMEFHLDMQQFEKLILQLLYSPK